MQKENEKTMITWKQNNTLPKHDLVYQEIVKKFLETHGNENTTL